MVTLTLQIGGNDLAFEEPPPAPPRQKAGGGEHEPSWKSKGSEARVLEGKVKSLKDKLEKLEAENAQVSGAHAGGNKQLNALQFKVEVLLDMLAVSKADEQVSLEKFEKERGVAEGLRREVARLTALVERGK